MLEPPVSYQAPVSLWYRGPEFAFAVPEGDLEALIWVLKRLNYWNGANCLIIPIRKDGRTWPGILDLLDAHPVEVCWVHESVSGEAADRARTKLGDGIRQWSDLHEGFDDYELHPLHLQSPPGTIPAPELREPVFESKRLQRIGLAVWGCIPDAQRSDYEERFAIGQAMGSDAHIAMLEGQLDQSSPVEQSIKLIENYGPISLGRSVYVFDRGSFGELVEFWNLRSRARDVGGKALFYGIAKESLVRPESLLPLRRKIRDDNWMVQTPDIGLCNIGDKEKARAALEEIGFEKLQETGLSRSIGRGRSSKSLSFGFFGPSIRGPFKRGAVVSDQLTVTEGGGRFRPSRPPEFPRTGQYIRFIVENLPLAMPPNDFGAGKVISNAITSREGLLLKTHDWIGDGYLEFSIPDAWQALVDWAADRGAEAALSSDGRYGLALLERLESLEDIRVLADGTAISVLEALAPVSRKKLAQRLVAEAKEKADEELSEAQLVELLAKQAMFLELRARSAEEISSAAKVSKQAVLAPLAELVSGGFVSRGAAVRCPTCGHKDVITLDEQDERLRCRACRARFLLPVLDSSKERERPPVYRLDGLMAWVMDQDLLPVMLCLRSLLGRSGKPKGVWPGVRFKGPGDRDCEYDLVLSNGATVWVAECKLRASGLSDLELDRLIEFCRRFDSVPVIAAPNGGFAASQRSSIEAVGGLALEADDLLA